MMSSTLRRGFSDEIGSWKIIFMRVRILRRCSPDNFVRSWPSKCTTPEFGRGSCMIALPVVDLPQPDSPTRPSVSPGITSMLTSETACTFRPVRPTGNSTTRFSTRSSASSAVAQVRGPAAGHQPPTVLVTTAPPAPPTGVPAAVSPAARLRASASLPGLGADREEAPVRVPGLVAFVAAAVPR